MYPLTHTPDYSGLCDQMPLSKPLNCVRASWMWFSHAYSCPGLAHTAVAGGKFPAVPQLATGLHSVGSPVPKAEILEECRRGIVQRCLWAGF